MASSFNFARYASRKRRKAEAQKAAQTSTANQQYKSLIESSGQLAGEGNLGDPLANIRKQAESAQSLLAQGESTGAFNAQGTKGAFKKKDVQNLLKAAGMREAQLRAKKAAPGFAGSKSLVG